MVLDFMTNLDYNVQADNLKCKQPEQNVEKSRSLVERARLEIVYTPQGYRGFESLLLRHLKRTKKMFSAKTPILSGFFAALKAVFSFHDLEM